MLLWTTFKKKLWVFADFVFIFFTTDYVHIGYINVTSYKKHASLTITARESILDVRIWHVKTSDSDN